MSLIRPFAGVRPAKMHDTAVVAPPYDVVSEAEARALTQNRPWNFLHVSRAEVDLSPGTDPHAAEVYAKAAGNFAAMQGAGILARDAQPYYYVYRQWAGSHVQTGLVATVSVAAYDQGRVKRHEHTRPAKEDDRVRHIEALNAQTGPAFLVYRAQEAVDDLLARVAEAPPNVNIFDKDDVHHQLWVVVDPAMQAALSRAFDALPALYIADGHHRTAAASRVAAARRAANPGHTGDEGYNYFLAVIFPHIDTQILAYNRVVRDLNGLDRTAFLERLGQAFRVVPSVCAVKPAHRGEFGMYLDGQWYQLALAPGRVPADDPVASLDASLLSDHLLAPILGIGDPRRDERIDFVGGSRGLEALERRVDSGEMRVAFSLYPTAMEDVMAVADRGEVMPPKSTWFEPKLADGLFSHILD